MQAADASVQRTRRPLCVFGVSTVMRSKFVSAGVSLVDLCYRNLDLSREQRPELSCTCCFMGQDNTTFNMLLGSSG